MIRVLVNLVYLRPGAVGGSEIYCRELLTALEVPWNEGWTVRASKVSKRFDSDISALCGAFALRLEHGVVTDVRLAWGGALLITLTVLVLNIMARVFFREKVSA
jgi:CO/xanthine dehydrogenase FAD-binding subunit